MDRKCWAFFAAENKSKTSLYHRHADFYLQMWQETRVDVEIETAAFHLRIFFPKKALAEIITAWQIYASTYSRWDT